MPYKYKINEGFFNNWNRGMGYVTGWIYADGTLRKNRYQFKIASNDSSVLQNIKGILKSNHKIREEPRKDRNIITKVLVIDSKPLYTQLKKIGLTPNKSKLMRLPQIPNEFFPDFLRGYFEGDGSIYMDRPVKRYPAYRRLRLSFCSGSKLFLEELQEKISKFWGLKNKSIRKNHSGFDIAYSTYEALKILKSIYKYSSSQIRLERKYLIYKNFFKNFSYKN